MAHQIDYRLVGDDMQAVIIALDPGETVQAEAGAMMFMEDGIEMNADLQGGILGGLKRVVSGEGLFFARLTGPGKVYLQTLPFSRMADRIMSASGFGSKDEVKRGVLGKLLYGD